MDLENPIKKKCIAIAEYYDIDWYKGEFASVFWNKDTSDEYNFEHISPVHEENLKNNECWGNARSKIVNALEKIQGRLPSTAGNPSWLLRAITEDNSSERDGNLIWVPGTDIEMGQAICKAQIAFIDFKEKLNEIIPEEALIKAFFPHLANPETGEHIYVTDPTIDGNTIKGTIWFEVTSIPGLTSGQEVSVDISRLSDWFYILEGQSYGGYTLPVLASRMEPYELEEAKEYPPFEWYNWD